MLVYVREAVALLGITLSLFPLTVWGKGTLAVTGVEVLKTLDVPHPFCDEPPALAVAADFFVEVGNDLPGVAEYNKLIRDYRSKRFERFDEGIASFHRRFESSVVLREGLAFLEVQSKFDRIRPNNVDDVKAAERRFREILVLYPKSEFLPILSATTANYWLANRSYEKSLSLYQVAKSQHPFHSLSCVFQMGVAESHFGLGDLVPAAAGYKQVLQKCQNQRLKVGAEIRLVDIRSQKGDAGAEGVYESAFNRFSNRIYSEFPSALYNLGELKYRSRKFKSARFFFGEYQKTPAKTACHAYALKRLADIAFRLGTKLEEVVGLYLVAKGGAPSTDAGVFSNLHALLLELPNVPPPEYDRRIRVIDEDLDKLQTEALRSLGYLEKGLVLLSMGKEAALDYLIRLNERTDFNLHRGPVASFLREGLLKLLETKIERVSESEEGETTKRKNKLDALFQSLEHAHALWLKGTPHEKKGKKLYGELVLSNFAQAMKKPDLPRALGLLSQWKSSSLWDAKGITASTKAEIGTQLLSALYKAGDDNSVAIRLSEEEPLLSNYVEGALPMFWAAVAFELHDPHLLQRRAKSILGGNRAPSSLMVGLPADVQSYLWLVAGESYSALRRYPEAEAALKQVKHPALHERGLRHLFSLYSQIRRYSKAYETVMALFHKLPAESKKQWLGSLFETAVKGKLWDKALELLRTATELGVAGKEAARFHYFTGNAHYARSKCDLAVGSYEKALGLEASLPEALEGKFKLGKCFITLGKRGQAQQVLEDLAAQNDSFWAPLARNEIKLLSP